MVSLFDWVQPDVFHTNAIVLKACFFMEGSDMIELCTLGLNLPKPIDLLADLPV